jgi:hypothetical protein
MLIFMLLYTRIYMKYVCLKMLKGYTYICTHVLNQQRRNSDSHTVYTCNGHMTDEVQNFSFSCGQRRTLLQNGPPEINTSLSRCRETCARDSWCMWGGGGA